MNKEDEERYLNGDDGEGTKIFFVVDMNEDVKVALQEGRVAEEADPENNKIITQFIKKLQYKKLQYGKQYGHKFLCKREILFLPFGKEVGRPLLSHTLRKEWQKQRKSLFQQ